MFAERQREGNALPRALITGASGFLGRHIVRRLGVDGWSLDLIDIQPLPDSPAVNDAIQADIREVLPSLSRPYDLAIHLAASVGGRVGIEHDPLGVATNMALDAEFFSFVSRSSPSRCIYLSSSAVYPVDRQTSSNVKTLLSEVEVDLQRGPLGLPDMTYGWAKLTGEYLAIVTEKCYEVPITIYRPFSIYGPGQTADYPITAICARALQHQDPLAIWGSGSQERDFVHVEDFLDLLLLTYKCLDACRPLNIASGVGVNFGQVARIAAGLVEYEPAVQTLQDRPSGVDRRVGCPKRLSEWGAPVIDLKSGLASIVKSLADNASSTNLTL